ncbi:glycosyltransferase [Flagellimonas olearia]|uniref:Glycosyltransferase n=1 Tax=Flagellimonas olearia TaxID=552546 RepID=A0A6I1E207_9FLAO|nr:glycosyltransferase [Allomuricauda olearia]KAB7530489.1 glycosyltransferase [Allomuricauda olearia]
MKDKTKIIFILPSLTAGGAERILSFVAANVDKKRFHSTLVVIGSPHETKLNVDGVDIIYFEKPRVLYAIPKLIHFLRNERPEIVVSSIFHLNLIMAFISFLFPKMKFVAREATVLSKRKSSPLLKVMVRFLYTKFDAIICQSNDMASDLSLNYHIPRNKLEVINNPITYIPKIKKKPSNGEIIKYITVGRLEEVKGHSRILRILSALDNPFLYTIIGQGTLKDVLWGLAKQLNIDKKIVFVPHTNNVHEYLASHDLFLQGSYVEGFPNALLESCTVGTPCIAFDVPGGTKEIIENGVNGFLVNDENEFLNKLMVFDSMNPITVSNSVLEKFHPSKILLQYERLLMKIKNIY